MPRDNYPAYETESPSTASPRPAGGGRPPIPSLMEHLRLKYAKYLSGMASERDKAPATSALRAELNVRLAEAKTFDGFVAFCEYYLGVVNAPTSTWFAGNGIGLILADSARVTMSRAAAAPTDGRTAAGPGQPAGGQMQDSGSVEITTGEGLGAGLPQ